MGIKIIMLDDQEMVGQGIAHLLSAETDIDVLKAFSELHHLEYYIETLLPDIVLCEAKISGINMLLNLRALVDKYDKTRFIILTGYDIEEYKARAYDNGAVAFILKEESADYLIDSLRKVYYFNRNLLTEIKPEYQLLTVREREILALVARDMTNKEISEALFVSKRTVEYQVSSLIRKLEVESRVGAVIKGLKLGIIEEDIRM
ncbi:response regulator transcription factor [Macrococcus equipercicus]|uniref:Response regulator transcription factor n=1 Tax=Macrococcus equipercicus TaxID=69967 RepID=A0ABQ6R7B5_9STAP|nr:response regulator transcription factor [Macrococcus equipercicus]KAA1037738.1 response regulator transcription factor [Macrococcus equipercicus]